MIQPTVERSNSKLYGLDRVYFQQILDLSKEPIIDSLLAKQLSEIGHDSDRYSLLPEITVQDFPLGGKAMRIRQVVSNMNPRIAETWWALYAGEERTSLWRFTADPSENDGKTISNYVIDSVFQSDEKNLVIRVRGEMFRPMGWWWMTGKVFAFDEVDSGFVLSYVENSFGFFSGEDESVTVRTEDRIGDHFERSEVENVPKVMGRRCGFRFSEFKPGEPEPTWDERRAAAQCMTKNAAPTTRALHEPSFIERGGK